MENGSEHNKNDADDKIGYGSDESTSGAPADHASNTPIPLSENTQLALQIGRLQQENAYLKAKINELEADKKSFMEEAAVRPKKQLEKNSPAANMPATSASVSPRQQVETKPLTQDTPAKPKKADRKPIQFKVPDRLDPDRDFYEELDEPPEQIPLPVRIRFFWRRNFILLQRLVLSVVLLGIFAAVYFFFIKDSALVEVDESLAGRGNVAQLLSESRSYVDQPELTMAIRFDHANKRIEIADRLLKWKNDKEAQKSGTLSKIRALTRLELLNLEFAESNPEAKRKLREITNATLDSSDSRTTNIAHAAQALLSVLDYLDESDAIAKTDAVRSQQRATAIQDFENAAKISSDDYTSAWALFDIASLMNSQKTELKIPELLDLFRNKFSTSNNPSNRNMAVEAKKRYLMGQQQLTNVSSGAESQVETLITDLSSELESLLALPDIDAGQYERISHHIGGVIRTGRIEDAREMIQKTLEKIGSDEQLQPVRSELKIMRTRTGLIGQSFSLNGLSELDGTPAVFRPEVTAKIIMFISTPAYRQCIQRLNNVTTTINRLLAQARVSIAIVIQDDGSEAKELAKLSQLKTARKLLDVWKIDLQSDEGQKFLQRFPITTIPFLIIINTDDELTAIDPPEDVLQSVIVEILDAQ